MDVNYEDRNKSQIIRQDARNCFVESKSDAFGIGKVHLEFAAYDASKPEGQRQTNHVHIYLAVPEFLCLAQEAVSGMLHARARQMKANKNTVPLYQSLGGTSAEKLKLYGRSRPDGKSLSRIVKLIYSDKKDDFYLFVADSGPGETNDKGLIVPKFGNKPENHVAISMSWQAVNEFMMMTQVHYQAWLAAKYMTDNSANGMRPPNLQPESPRYNPQKQGQVKEQPANNNSAGKPSYTVNNEETSESSKMKMF